VRPQRCSIGAFHTVRSGSWKRCDPGPSWFLSHIPQNRCNPSQIISFQPSMARTSPIVGWPPSDRGARDIPIAPVCLTENLTPRIPLLLAMVRDDESKELAARTDSHETRDTKVH
jgi:hypothetical protein